MACPRAELHAPPRAEWAQAADGGAGARADARRLPRRRPDTPPPGAPPADTRPLLLVGGQNYPPLSYLERGQPAGYDVDIARALGAVLGREVRIELMDWAEAQTRVLNGNADGLTNLAISNERRALYDFADSTITQNFGLFVRVGDTSLGGVSDLLGRSVGVTEWGFPRQYLEQQPRVRLVIVDDLREGFQRLATGELDVVAADVWVAAHLLEQARMSGIALAGAPFASLPAAIAIRKGNPGLVADLNRAITTLERDGTLFDIQEKWRPREMVFLSRERVQDLVAWGIGAFLVLLLMAATGWALLLRRQMRERRAAEAAALEVSQRLGLALASADAGTWRWVPATDIDTRDATLNRMLGLATIESAQPLADMLERIHPDDRPAMQAEFERAIRDRNGYLSEFRVIRPDGTMRWLRGRGRPFFDEHGTLQYVTGAAIDITERREVEERLALLARAFESTSESMAITDGDDRILDVNNAFLQMNEYERGDVIGQPVTIVRAPGQSDPAGVDSFKKTSDSWHGEVQCISKSGRIYPASLSRSVLRDASGRIVATVGVARDITTETLAEAALRASEEKFYKVFQASPDAIIISDLASRAVIDVNDSFERLSGFSRSDVLGRSLGNLGLFVDPGSSDRAVARLRDPGSFRAQETQVRRKDGEIRTCVVSGEALAIAGRACSITIGRDITEQRRFELHLRQAVEVNKLLLTELDPEGLYRAVIEAAHQILDLDYVSLLLRDAETGVWTLEAQRGILGAAVSVAVGQVLSIQTFEHGAIRLHHASDLAAAAAPLDALTKAGLEWVCSLPLVTARGTLGVLNVGGRQQHTASSDAVTLLQQLSTHVAIAIQNAQAYEEIRTLKDELSQEKLYLQEEIRVDHNFADIVGESPAIKRVLQQIETVAPTEASVLILGETGTGKELLARALHDLSPRKDRTFVRLNVAALPTTLLESELFGYERGAFTGATSGKVGRMELAHRGTLFLDEVGDIPLEVQPKLLRALQEREFERLGGTRTQRVDVRLIAATNRDLARMVEEGTFRSDLYYRLNVFPLQVPPLRDRRDDIPLLVRYFVQRFSLRFKRAITSIPAGTMAALQEWDWPGNIRELENVIERAVVVSTGDTLQVPAFQPKASEAPATVRPVTVVTTASFADGERSIILRALRDTKGVIAEPEGAAARLGMKRTTLQSKMAKLGIRRPSF